MSGYVLDTNVISELRKKPVDTNVAAWWETVSTSEIYLSVLVIGELWKGVANIERRDPPAAKSLERWLETLLATSKGRILSVGRRTAERWGRLQAVNPLPVIDGLLAATALEHDLTLVTRNVRDVERTGVKLLNPFEPAR